MLHKDFELVLVVFGWDIRFEDVESVAIQETDELLTVSFDVQLAFIGSHTVAPNDQMSVAVPHLFCRAASGLLNIDVPMGSPSRACAESCGIVLPKSANWTSANLIFVDIVILPIIHKDITGFDMRVFRQPESDYDGVCTCLYARTPPCAEPKGLLGHISRHTSPRGA